MPPDTNRCPSIGGGWIQLGGRKLAGVGDAVGLVAAIHMLTARDGVHVFTVRDVFQEMVQAGTRYVESTVFKTIQRMKVPPERPPFVLLERAGRGGFRFA